VSLDRPSVQHIFKLYKHHNKEKGGQWGTTKFGSIFFCHDELPFWVVNMSAKSQKEVKCVVRLAMFDKYDGWILCAGSPWQKHFLVVTCPDCIERYAHL